MIHPDTEVRRINSHVGFGVFASSFIPRGTITWVKDLLDLVVSPAQVAKMPPAYQQVVARYTFNDPHGNHVLSWDFSRYMNHSCEPSVTCLGTMCDVARVDIHPGDQLTCEYAFNNVDDDFRCTCGAPHCRGTVRANDILSIAARADEEMIPLVERIKLVAQPIVEFLPVAERLRLDAILAGKERIPSCLENAAQP